MSILDPHKAGIQIKETGPNRIKYFFYILNANVFFSQADLSLLT